MPATLKQTYRNDVVPALQKEFNYKNPNQVPRIEKVVLNMGLGEAVQNVKVIEAAVQQLGAITGQRPVVTVARNSISNFKLREGQPIGVMVTLRSEQMYEFIERLFNVALARVKDFRGVSPKAFDGKGNYTLGVKEQIIFPEINYENIEKVKGMNITFVTSARTDEEARVLLAKLGMPFREN